MYFGSFYFNFAKCSMTKHNTGNNNNKGKIKQ